MILPQEIKPGMIQPTWPGHTFTQSEIQSGDIICFQAETSDQETHDLESQGLCSNPVQFYNFLLNRVMVSFRPRLGEPSTDQPEFSLALSKKQKYDAVSYCLFASPVLGGRYRFVFLRWLPGSENGSTTNRRS